MTRFPSPLRYPGGKSKVAKKIVSFFPEGFTHYCEPFFGGGSVFFEIERRFSPKSNWINDKNKDLINFWSCAKECNFELVEGVRALRNKYLNNGRELFDYINNDFLIDSKLKSAIRFFILNRISFSGLTDSGGYSQQAFDLRFNDSSIKRLGNISKPLRYCQITNHDFSEVISRTKPGTFLYLDPPYYQQRFSKLYGKNGDLHVNFDHERLAKELYKCKHNWLITYDDAPYIRDLYKNWSFFSNLHLQYSLQNTINGAKKGVELIITNYEIKNL